MPVNAHGGEYIQFYVNGVSTTTSSCFSYSSDGNVGVGTAVGDISYPSMSINPEIYYYTEPLSYHFKSPDLDKRHFILGNMSNKKEITHMRRLLLEGK